jgi:hypothetical protein
VHFLAETRLDKDDRRLGIVDDLDKLCRRKAPVEGSKGASDFAGTEPRVKEAVTIHA